MSNKIIDIELLKLIPQTSEKAKTLLQIFSQRKRSRKVISFLVAYHMLRVKGIKLNKEEFKEICINLEHAGVGKALVSGKNVKFDWSWHTRSVAEVALGIKEYKSEFNHFAERKPLVPKLDVKEPSVIEREIVTKPNPFSNIVTVRGGGFEVVLKLEELTPEGCHKIKELFDELSEKTLK